jgi:hypothetical protein
LNYDKRIDKYTSYIIYRMEHTESHKLGPDDNGEYDKVEHRLDIGTGVSSHHERIDIEQKCFINVYESLATPKVQTASYAMP